MPAADIRAGGAYVEATVKDDTAAKMKEIEKRVKDLGASISAVGSKFAIAGAAITASFIPCIKIASDFNETVSQFEIVFGEQKGAMRSWADEFANQVGRAKGEVYKYLSVSKAMLIGLKFDDTSANEMSQTIAKLTVDFASFYNLTEEDAFTKIKSGLSGEAEPLKALGVVVSETTTNLELMAEKLDPKEATEAQKTYARLQIILGSTKTAQGDAVRTADQFANTMRRLQGQVLDAATAIGTALLPAVTKLASGAGSLIGTFASIASACPAATIAVAALGVGLVGLGGSLLAVGKSIEIFVSLQGSINLAKAALFQLVGIAADANVWIVLSAAINLCKIKLYEMVAASLAFMATPLGIALSVAAVAMAALGYAAYQASQRMSDLQTATEGAAKAQKALSESDSRRKDDNTAVERLKQLAELGIRTAAQNKEAADLVAQLNAHYVGLGLQIDQTTGKIIGLGAAQAKVAKDQKAQAEKDLNNEIAAEQAKLKAQREAQGSGKSGNGLSVAFDAVAGLGMGGTAGKDISAAGTEIEATIKKLADLKQRQNALKGGDASAVTGAPKANDTAANVEEDKKKIKDKQDAEADAQKKLGEAQDSLIQDQYNRELAQINRKYDEEAKRMKEAGADTKALEAARKIEQDQALNEAKARWKQESEDQKKAAAEKVALGLRSQKELADAQAREAEGRGDVKGAQVARKQARDVDHQVEASQTKQQLDDQKVSPEEQAKILAALKAKQRAEDRTADAKDANDARDRIEENAALERSLKKQQLEDEAKLADAKGDKTGADAKRKQVKQLDHQDEDVQLEKKLRDSGLSDADKAKLRNIQKQAQKAQDDTPANTSAKVVKSVGTFDGSNAGIRGLQVTNEAKRTAIASEATVKELKKLNEKKGLTFSNK